MKSKRKNNISESQVEDSLVANLTYLAEILNLPPELRLIARQLRLKSGKERIDLLLTSGKKLCLIELKIVDFSMNWLEQIISYRNELMNLQKDDKLVSGDILCYLLVTDAKSTDIELAKQNNVNIVIYKPIEVLKNYYENLATVAPFLKTKPNEYGVFSLGLINRTLVQLDKGITEQKEVALNTNLSKFSVHNHLKIAKEFGLVRDKGMHSFLTDMGDKYMQLRHEDKIFTDHLSNGQVEILKDFVANDPFFSSTVFGIYSIVESAFFLARNSYPIEFSELRKMFQNISGKMREWRADRTLTTATYTFINFAIDLELLGKIGKQIVITPSGFRFVLMLQLHKSIEMVESLSVNYD